jgi:pimeloyl-ACP methyl ester carboxylesterase
MATFVLIHGGTLGGYSWQAVRRYLHAAGHPTFAPSLTGLGDRVHLASPEVGLAAHVADVANLLWYEDLSRVVWVEDHDWGTIQVCHSA